MNLITDDLSGKEIYFIDLETTALNHNVAEILQFAALRYSDDLNEWRLFNKYYLPHGHLSDKIVELTGLTREFLTRESEGYHFDEDYKDVLPYLAPDKILVGHNIKLYDFKVLESNFRKLGIPLPRNFNSEVNMFDTMLSASMFPCYAGTNLSRVKAVKLYADTMKTCGIPEHVSKVHPEKLLRALGGSEEELAAHNAKYDVCMNAFAVYMARKQYKALTKK